MIGIARSLTPGFLFDAKALLMRHRMLLQHFLGVAIGAAVFAIALWYMLPAETGTLERTYCTALAVALAVVIAVASGRVGIGLLIAGALAGTIWYAGVVKFAYLQEPLLAPDLRYYLNLTTLGVIAHYPRMLHKLIAALVIGPLLIGVVWWLESPGLWGMLRRSPRRLAMRGRLVIRAVCTALAVASLTVIAWPHGPFHSLYAVQTWGFVVDASSNSNPTTNFLISFARLHVTVPAYTPTASSRDDWGAATQAPADKPARYPDLIAVLEESTLDPRQWAVCDVPRCDLPMFNPDAATKASGLLKVHTYGGATWVSEFAFLTGLPHTLFGPAGAYAPYNLAPRMRDSLPRELKALGYRTIAIYPMPRTFVRAGDAYVDYGFDEFHDSKELGIDWTNTDADLMRRFENILRSERAKDDRPLFFMVLTMRQHGPHDYPLSTLPPPWNQPPVSTQSAIVNRNLATYLFRLHQSSDAIAALRKALFADGRPTVLTYFGDHHPSFDGLERKLASALPVELQHEASSLTYFRIDSNMERAPMPDYRVLDLAFLGGLMLDVAGLPKDAYFTANTEFRDRCKGRFIDCPDKPMVNSYLAHVFGDLDVFAR